MRDSGFPQHFNVEREAIVADDIGKGYDNSEGFEVGGKERSEQLEDGRDVVVEAVKEEAGVLSDEEKGVGGRSAFGGQEVEFGENPSGGVA